MLRYYRIKAYLNASHFVVFDGKKGDTHPHTWEFVATVYTTGNNIIKFTEPEIAEAVKPIEYHLRRFEGSETPVRTYGVRFPEAEGVEDENEADEVEAAIGRLEKGFEL